MGKGKGSAEVRTVPIDSTSKSKESKKKKQADIAAKVMAEHKAKQKAEEKTRLQAFKDIVEEQPAVVSGTRGSAAQKTDPPAAQLSSERVDAAEAVAIAADKWATTSADKVASVPTEGAENGARAPTITDAASAKQPPPAEAGWFSMAWCVTSRKAQQQPQPHEVKPQPVDSDKTFWNRMTSAVF